MVERAGSIPAPDTRLMVSLIRKQNKDKQLNYNPNFDLNEAIKIKRWLEDLIEHHPLSVEETKTITPEFKVVEVYTDQIIKNRYKGMIKYLTGIIDDELCDCGSTYQYICKHECPEDRQCDQHPYSEHSKYIFEMYNIQSSDEKLDIYLNDQVDKAINSFLKNKGQENG